MSEIITHDHRWTMDACEVRTDAQGRSRAHWTCCGEWARGLWAGQPEAIEAEKVRMSSPELPARQEAIHLDGAKHSIKFKYSRWTAEMLGRFTIRMV